LQQRRRWRQRQAKQRRQQNRTEATPTWPCLSSVTLSRNQRSRFTASMIYSVGCTLHVSQRPIDGRDELIFGRTKSLSTAGEMKIQRHSFVASLARFRILLLLCLFIFCILFLFLKSARERSRWGQLGNLTVEICKDLWEPIVDRKILGRGSITWTVQI
jgi:hypothetical protein